MSDNCNRLIILIILLSLFLLPGSHSTSHQTSRGLAFRDADVFLLCYKISDPNTLFSALNFWCPEIRAESPSTPIILVGCQSDTRSDRDLLHYLSKQGKAPVSSDQALSFSQQIGALMYVETSAKASTRASVSAFEVAALASMGKIVPKCAGGTNVQARSSSTPRSTPSPRTVNKKQRFSSISPGDSLERSEEEDGRAPLYNLEPTVQFWEQFNQFQSPKLVRSHSECPKTPSIASSSRSASLSSSKTRSSTSIPSISSSLGPKTPKSTRKSATLGKGGSERMITIKCQRLTADKTYEEIEVEVPAPIYDTIQLYNDTGSLAARGSSGKEKRSLGAKLKNLFSSSSSN